MKCFFAILLGSCVSFHAFAQNVLTADGLAAFTTNAPTGGGGGDDLSNLTFRWVADDISQTDGSTIALWPDHLGNGHGLIGGYNGFNVSPSGAIKPVVSNSVPAFNSHNVVYFNGSTELATNFAMSLIGSSTTVFVVMKQDGSRAENSILNSLNSGHLDLYASYDDVIYFDLANNSSGRVSHAQPSGWDNNVHVVECHGTVGGTSEILIDGVSLTSGSISGTPTTGAEDFVVGSINFGGAANLKGWIAEIRIYSDNKNSTSRSGIRQALGTKYGVTITP